MPSTIARSDTRKAVVLHLDGIVGVVPLVGGYLKAFALDDPRVQGAWDIELWSEDCHVKASKVIRRLVDASPDVVAISVYTWNAGLVRRLMPALRGLLPPTTRYVLGGVEVMNVAELFVDPSWEDVVVCNGEGERMFRDLLVELLEDEPDVSRVAGLTYVRDGEFHTTPGQPRIQDMTELPSPWLTGVFDDLPTPHVALFETNRGCPFACEFCFWGGKTGQKIYQQDVQRVKDELTYIAKRGIRAMSICDANFGILPRDAEIAEHIVAVNREYNTLNRVVFNSSKVRPDRVERISGIFADAELLTRHVFSLQSMDEEVLRIAKRTSLAREPYREIQQRLNEQHMASLIELLWPMPGETLESFEEGVAELLGLGAQGFLIFPLVWLNNTGYRDRTEEHGVTVLPEADPSSGGEIVVRTAHVSFTDYLAGLRFALAVFVLHDCRGLPTTLQLLDRLGVASFRETLRAFADFMDEEAEGPIAELWREQLACFEDMVTYTWRGILADATLNHARTSFDALLVEFTERHPEWFSGEHGDLLRASVEWDLVCRPYAFLQTKCELGAATSRIELVEAKQRLYRVLAPFDLAGIAAALRTGGELTAELLAPRETPIRVDHKQAQLFMLPTRSEDEHLWMCTQAVQEVARIEPRCSVESAEGAAASTA